MLTRTVVLRPIETKLSGWTNQVPSDGLAHHLKVDESVDNSDGDTTSLNSKIDGQIDRFKLQNPPADVGSTISATVRASIEADLDVDTEVGIRVTPRRNGVALSSMQTPADFAGGYRDIQELTASDWLFDHTDGIELDVTSLITQSAPPSVFVKVNLSAIELWLTYNVRAGVFVVIGDPDPFYIPILDPVPPA